MGNSILPLPQFLSFPKIFIDTTLEIDFKRIGSSRNHQLHWNRSIQENGVDEFYTDGGWSGRRGVAVEGRREKNRRNLPP